MRVTLEHKEIIAACVEYVQENYGPAGIYVDGGIFTVDYDREENAVRAGGISLTLWNTENDVLEDKIDG